MSAVRAPITVLLRGEQRVVSLIDSWSEPGFGRAHWLTRFSVGCAGSMP
jgi:hypothetical protein